MKYFIYFCSDHDGFQSHFLFSGKDLAYRQKIGLDVDTDSDYKKIAEVKQEGKAFVDSIGRKVKLFIAAGKTKRFHVFRDSSAIEVK